MNPVKILIVEDEPLIAKDLAYTLEDIGYSVVKISYDAQEAFTTLKENVVDLVLLDINIDGDVDADRALRDAEAIMTTAGAFNDKATPVKSIISLLRDLNKLKDNAISDLDE